MPVLERRAAGGRLNARCESRVLRVWSQPTPQVIGLRVELETAARTQVVSAPLAPREKRAEPGAQKHAAGG